MQKEKPTLQEVREQAKEFYEKAVPYLEAQLKYESLCADIEEAKLKALVSKIRLADLSKPSESPNSDQNGDS